jgi:hypothetical protein
MMHNVVKNIGLKAPLAAAIALATLLSACGNKDDLEPAKGEILPVTPAGAPKQPTPEELMTPTTQARPERSDEPLKRSEERKDDEYDLPPPG